MVCVGGDIYATTVLNYRDWFIVQNVYRRETRTLFGYDWSLTLKNVCNVC